MFVGWIEVESSALVDALLFLVLHSLSLARGVRLLILASALLPFRFFGLEALLGYVGFVITALALRVLGVTETDALLLVIARWASLWV